jgi:hypothetical protein
MITRLPLHPSIKTEFNGQVYIGTTTCLGGGVLLEFLEQFEEENDEEDILPYFVHIEGFSLFRILEEGLEHVDGIGTCDLELPQLDIDQSKDCILRITGIDEV